MRIFPIYDEIIVPIVCNQEFCMSTNDWRLSECTMKHKPRAAPRRRRRTQGAAWLGPRTPTLGAGDFQDRP